MSETLTCQLCGEKSDIFTAYCIPPWGDTCADCVADIRRTRNGGVSE